MKRFFAALMAVMFMGATSVVLADDAAAPAATPAAAAPAAAAPVVKKAKKAKKAKKSQESRCRCCCCCRPGRCSGRQVISAKASLRFRDLVLKLS